ncbi:MAG: 50S ribosomal protein L21 [Bacteroidota bacterium]|nr:50S ribosomal protein L21 [Bacteroidota bacterium]
MYAVVDIAGQQFKVEKGQTLFVHRLVNAEGEEVNFEKVLLLSDDANKVSITGLENALVKATVLRHMKSDKIIVFKKKRRKGYKVRNGHRQYMSQVRIDDITA